MNHVEIPYDAREVLSRLLRNNLQKLLESVQEDIDNYRGEDFKTIQYLTERCVELNDVIKRGHHLLKQEPFNDNEVRKFIQRCVERRWISEADTWTLPNLLFVEQAVIAT